MSARPLAWLNRRVPSTVVALVLALAFGGGVLFEHGQDAALRERGLRTDAVVVKQDEGRYSSPWVQFTTSTGSILEVELRNDAGPSPLGALVPVIYDPVNPTLITDARATGISLTVFASSIAAVTALVLAGLTATGVIDWERRSRRR